MQIDFKIQGIGNGDEKVIYKQTPVVPLLCSVISHVFYPDTGFKISANIIILHFLIDNHYNQAGETRYLIYRSFEHEKYNYTKAVEMPVIIMIILIRQ